MVVGLRGPGRAVVESFAAIGVGTVVLADPFAPYPDEPEASGAASPPGVRREDLVADALDSRWPATRFERAGVALSRDTLPSLVDGCDLVVTALDPELSAARLWVNSASLSCGVPSLHAAVQGARAELGPVVLPGAGSCYLCWRMRALACVDDFAAAMAREEALDKARMPSESPRPVLPTLVPWVAGILGHEVLAVTLGIAAPRLAGHVLALDGLGCNESLHPVLQHPDCPACAKKDRPPRPPSPTLTELADSPQRTTDFDGIAAATISPLCGLIRTLDRFPKDVQEPEQPIIVGAELANAQFLAEAAGFVNCSGKGATVTAARDGALGEALERYAALTWVPDRRVYATRGELDGPSLHPRELVLFADDQYAELPYAPYCDDTALEWVPARSLTSGGEVWVPLLAAHLGYQVPDSAGYLFPTTSNGFAAGATLTGAVLRGLLEVVERDAFLLSWSHRLAGTRYDATTVPDPETHDIAAAYARRGVRIDVHLLPVDTAATVVLAAGWCDEQPAVVIGLGADLDPVAAARRAVLEVAQVRPALRSRLRQSANAARLAELVADPTRVAGLEDHDLLYADTATAAAGLGYLLDVASCTWDAVPVEGLDEATALRRLVSSLAEVAGDVLYVDTTPDDVARLGVQVARGIVPGFQPIHFGATEARLGGERLFRMPADLGLYPRPARRDELNLAPHPLA